MLNQISSKLGKQTLIFIFVTLFVFIVCIGYVLIIGIPKTTARNLYNEGHRLISNGEFEKGLTIFKDAYEAYPEDYIQKSIIELEQLILGYPISQE